MNNDETFKRLRADVTKYLMDVGIEAKVEGTRILPDVTPIHGVPTAVAEASVSRQPRLPQPQRGPPGCTVTWPSSAAR